jgi:hypothetical protein
MHVPDDHGLDFSMSDWSHEPRSRRNNARIIIGVMNRRFVILGVIGLLLVVAAVARSNLTFLRGVGSRAPVVTHEIVVEQLREVAKLVASELTLRDVVTYEQSRLGSTKRTLLVVTGRVSAGINLTRAQVNVDQEKKVIAVTLPSAEIISVDVSNVTTYDERAGLWNPFTTDDRDEIRRRIRAQLVTAAEQSGILGHADQAAAKALTNLLTRDGYTVQINRPLALDKPTG